MVKFVGIVRLNPGHDPKEVLQQWRTGYSPKAAQLLLPELKHYTRNWVVKSIGETDIFGFSEMLFDDVESCERALARRISDAGLNPPWSVERIVTEFEEVPLL